MLRKVSFKVYGDINNDINLKEHEENPMAVIVDFTAFQNGLPVEYTAKNKFNKTYIKNNSEGVPTKYTKHWTREFEAPVKALEAFIEKITKFYPSSPVYFVVPREASFNIRIVSYGVVAMDPDNLIWWTDKREGKGKNGQPSEGDARPESNWNSTKARIMNVVNTVKYRINPQGRDVSNIQGSSKSKTLCDSTSDEEADAMVYGDEN